jgi:hypothetical protein
MWLKTWDCKANQSTATATGRAVETPDSRDGIKAAMLLGRNGAPIKLNLSGFKMACQCTCSKKQGTLTQPSVSMSVGRKNKR